MRLQAPAEVIHAWRWLGVGGAFAVAACIAQPALADPNRTLSEACGWLVFSDDALVMKPDAKLHPSEPGPLPPPPNKAKAAYCVRDTMMTFVGDERLVKLGLPLVIRSGEREGVLEAPPQVKFNYHVDGSRYLPGAKPSQP